MAFNTIVHAATDRLQKMAGETAREFITNVLPNDPRYADRKRKIDNLDRDIERSRKYLTTDNTPSGTPWWVKLLSPIESMRAASRGRSFQKLKNKGEKEYAKREKTNADATFDELRKGYDQWKKDKRSVRNTPKSDD